MTDPLAELPDDAPELAKSLSYDEDQYIVYGASGLIVGGPTGVEAQDVEPGSPVSRHVLSLLAASVARVRTPAEALAWARARDRWASGMCLQFVRSCFGVPAVHPDASTAWAATQHRHTSTPPAGVPVWWTGGRRGFGHVAISAGGGRIVSTDVPSSGRVGTTTIRALTSAWGHTYRGWSEDINGYRVADFTQPPDQEDDDMPYSKAEIEQMVRNGVAGALANSTQTRQELREVIGEALAEILAPVDVLDAAKPAAQRRKPHRALIWLRVAPWHQMLGRTTANMHQVIGELRAAATKSEPAATRKAIEAAPLGDDE